MKINMTQATPEALLWQLQLDQQGGITDDILPSQGYDEKPLQLSVIWHRSAMH